MSNADDLAAQLSAANPDDLMAAARQILAAGGPGVAERALNGSGAPVVAPATAPDADREFTSAAIGGRKVLLRVDGQVYRCRPGVPSAVLQGVLGIATEAGSGDPVRVLAALPPLRALLNAALVPEDLVRYNGRTTGEDLRPYDYHEALDVPGGQPFVLRAEAVTEAVVRQNAGAAPEVVDAAVAAAVAAIPDLPVIGFFEEVAHATWLLGRYIARPTVGPASFG